MENTDLEKTISDRMQELPLHIQTAIKKIEWAPAVLEIGKKHGLHMEQMEVLQTETMLVLIGLVHPNDYAGALRTQLGVPEATIAGIVADVNEKILKDVRDDLAHFIEDEQKAETATNDDILKKSGVEITPTASPIENRGAELTSVVPQAETDILINAGVNVDDGAWHPDLDSAPQVTEPRATILEDLEHPPKTETTGFSNLAQKKLSVQTALPQEKTKYEDKKPVTPTPPAKSGTDPYREPVQ